MTAPYVTSEKRQKTEQLLVRLTPAEMAEFRSVAAALGRSPQELLRSFIDSVVPARGYPPRPILGTSS